MIVRNVESESRPISCRIVVEPRANAAVCRDLPKSPKDARDFDTWGIPEDKGVSPPFGAKSLMGS